MCLGQCDLMMEQVKNKYTACSAPFGEALFVRINGELLDSTPNLASGEQHEYIFLNLQRVLNAPPFPTILIC